MIHPYTKHKTLYTKIFDWTHKNFVRKPMYYYNKAKTIVRWIPFIFKDRPSDYEYLLTAIELKLTLMHEFWSSNKPIKSEEKCDQCRKQIKNALDIITRIKSDSYYDGISEIYNMKKLPKETKDRIVMEINITGNTLKQLDFDQLGEILSGMQEWWN